MDEELKVDNVSNVQGKDNSKDVVELDKATPQPQRPLNDQGNKTDDLGTPITQDTVGDKPPGGENGVVDGNKVSGGNAGGGPIENTSAGITSLANDETNTVIAEVLASTMNGEGHGNGNQRESGEPFDKLEDLVKKKAGKERRKGRKENSAGPEGTNSAGNEQVLNNQPQDGTPQAVKKSVDELRGGQLYMAVVLARQLEKGGHNPMADNKFNRFFNSSTFNSTADKIKLAGAVSATGMLLDPTYKKSSLSQAVSLVSNLVGLVTGIKTIVQKLKKFKTIKGKMNRVMSGIGLVSDFAMTISKAVGIAQSITVLSGKFQGVTKTVFKYLNAILGSVAQASGFISGAYGLKQARGKLNMMKTLENKRWEAIENTVLPKYSEAEEGEEEEDEEDSGESTTTSSAAQTAQEATGEGGKKKRLSLKQKREQAKQLKQSKKERRSMANMLLRREDVSDEDTDKLVGYIASCRMIGKIKSGIFMGISGLVANAIGLGTNIANGVSAGDSENKDAENAGNTMGIISGFLGSGISLAKIGIDKSNQKKQNNEETDMIKGRLWGLIHGLDDNKYGLKGISESLEAKPSPEKAEEAKGVVNKYKAVDGQLRGAFVDYGAVLKANSAEEFRKLLVSGI